MSLHRPEVHPDQPIIALDVNGVLAPTGVEAHRRPHGFRFFDIERPGDEPQIGAWLNPAHGEMLLDLADQGAHLVWASEWEEKVNADFGPALGLPPLPYIRFPRYSSRPWEQDGWKFPAVLAYTLGHPLLWFDCGFDRPGLIYDTKEFWLARAEQGLEQDTALYGVDREIGLTGAAFAFAHGFIAGARSRL